MGNLRNFLVNFFLQHANIKFTAKVEEWKAQ